ncbi:hypothetical protein PAXRUDRAFT_798447, partial [Paxillus rubicundulus Ve08.2h10]
WSYSVGGLPTPTGVVYVTPSAPFISHHFRNHRASWLTCIRHIDDVVGATASLGRHSRGRGGQITDGTALLVMWARGP